MHFRFHTVTLAGLLYGLLSFAAFAQDKDLESKALHARTDASMCANCHGTNGNARGDMKSLAGTPAERTVALMNYYKTTPQPQGVTIMHQIAKGYTDDQIKLIAGYFAAQQPKK